MAILSCQSLMLQKERSANCSARRQPRRPRACQAESRAAYLERNAPQKRPFRHPRRSPETPSVAARPTRQGGRCTRQGALHSHYCMHKKTRTLSRPGRTPTHTWARGVPPSRRCSGSRGRAKTDLAASPASCAQREREETEASGSRFLYLPFKRARQRPSITMRLRWTRRMKNGASVAINNWQQCVPSGACTARATGRKVGTFLAGSLRTKQDWKRSCKRRGHH